MGSAIGFARMNFTLNKIFTLSLNRRISSILFLIFVHPIVVRADPCNEINSQLAALGLKRDEGSPYCESTGYDSGLFTAAKSVDGNQNIIQLGLVTQLITRSFINCNSWKSSMTDEDGNEIKRFFEYMGEYFVGDPRFNPIAGDPPREVRSTHGCIPSDPPVDFNPEQPEASAIANCSEELVLFSADGTKKLAIRNGDPDPKGHIPRHLVYESSPRHRVELRSTKPRLFTFSVTMDKDDFVNYDSIEFHNTFRERTLLETIMCTSPQLDPQKDKGDNEPNRSY